MLVNYINQNQLTLRNIANLSLRKRRSSGRVSMASRSTSRISLGSDNCPDGKCGICSGEEYSECIRFCQNCGKNVCKACMIVHGTIQCRKTTPVHVTGAAYVRQSSENSSLPSIRYPCEEHPGEAIETFCEDHRSLCCSLCVTRTHTACFNVINLSEAVEKASSNRSVSESRKQQTISEVKKTRRDLKLTRKARYADKSRLDKERKDAIDAVKDYRRRLNENLDRMEENFLGNLTVRAEQTTASVTVDVKACDVMLHELQDVTKDLKGSDKDVDDFVNTQKAAARCREANRMLSLVEEHFNTGNLTFSIEEGLEDFLESFDEFGHFH